MDLPEYSIADIQQQFACHAWSAVSLCRAYLQRIAEIDQTGPMLRAVIEINPDALAIATALDEERQQRGPRGLLHGIPVLLKDSIDTADAMSTTAGSLALEGHVAPQDAGIVAKLRAAGAIMLGKTNMSEWSNFRSIRACSGWSSRGGQVRNPYALDRTPSGSSSGSAVAVAANLCTVAIGAETDGSITRPACVNGIVGLKPTVGLVSRSGMIPVAPSQDTAGPMGRTVTDVATVLNVLSGYDPRDPVTQQSVGYGSQDHCQGLDANGLQGARLGVARAYFGDHEGVDVVMAHVLKRLQAAGAQIVDPVVCGKIAHLSAPELELLLYECKTSLNAYLADHPEAPVRSLQDIIWFNTSHAERVMPYFQQELLERAQAKGGLDESDYQRAKATCLRLSRDEGIDQAMRDYALDALIAPTHGTPAWTIDPVVGDKKLGGCTSLAAMAGYPHITVPAGYVHGLPVGLSFIAGAYEEAKLLRYAYAFEQVRQERRPPRFLTMLEA